MRLTRRMRIGFLVLAVGLIVVGVLQFLAGGGGGRPTVRLLAAAVDIPAGAAISAENLEWVEASESVAAPYLRQVPAAGALALTAIGAGELISRRVIGSEVYGRRVAVTVLPAVVPVNSLRVGELVDIWVAGEPAVMLAVGAEVIGVQPIGQSIAGAPGQVDLLVDRAQLAPLMSAVLRQSSSIALARTPSIAAAIGWGASGETGNGG